MRQIQFRAWDKVLKEHLPNVQNHINSIEWAFGCMLKSDKCIVEQFTGRTDKNGKGIYEGDIIKAWQWIHDDDFNLVKNLDEYDIATVYWDDETLSWSIKSDLKHIVTDQLGYLSQIEIIGNVHEHSHLLQEQS